MKGTTISLFLLLQMINGVVCTEYSVTITTNPSQEPFKIGQNVQFSCFIEPAPPEPVTYRWKAVGEYNPLDFGTRTSNQQNISATYNYNLGTLHYCWYFCQVFMNQTLIGSSSKLIEVHGWLYTEEPIVRSFYSSDRLVLNVNISGDYARHISSLAWYHNGTRIITGNKFIISNNGTNLAIMDMREYDAGKYEVKINSINYNGRRSVSCDMKVLPLLESLAIHAPVTFLVQEYRPPLYDPSKAIISTYLITEQQDTITLSNEIYSDLFVRDRYYHNWYRNGTRVSPTNTSNQNRTILNSLQIMYNNSNDAIGHYIGVVTIRSHTLETECQDYYYYYRSIAFIFSRSIPILISHWNVKVYDPPSSVQLHFEDSILSYQESTVIECTAISREPDDTHNFTLWKNGRILAHNRGSSLRYSTNPSQYGTYRCAVDSVYNTSLLQEKAYFQLLLEDIQCDLFVNRQFQDLKRAIHVILDNLCQECDVYSFIFENMTLDCTVSQRFGFLTSALAYSNTDGTITASTLINMLFSWILTSEAKPSILVRNSTITLNQHCPSMVNSVTMDTCLRIVNSGSASTNAVPVAPIESKIIIAVTYPSGIITGIIMSIVAITLVICIRKIRRSPQARGVDSHRNEECDKSVEIAMGSNQAYESVDLRYQTGGRGKILETGMMTNEPIYEHPAL